MPKHNNINCINIIIVLILSLFALCGCEKNNSIKVLSFNMGFEKTVDGLAVWDSKKPVLERFFKKNDFDIMGLQDVSEEQFNEIQDILPNYSHFGANKTDYAKAGEYSPIFYDKNSFTLLTKSQFWLSEMPDSVINNNLDEVSQHVVNWGRLSFNKTGHIFYVFNTRFAYDNKLLQDNSARFLLKRIKEIAGNAPVIVMGDFNLRTNENVYNILTTNWDRFLSLEDTDSFINKKPKRGNETKSNISPKLDCILINGYFDVLSYKMQVIEENEKFISEHCPVSAKIYFLFDRRFRHGELFLDYNN